MTNTTSSNFYDTDQGQPKKLPGFLNVLTIITMVGCAIEFISAIWRYFSADKSYDQIMEAQKQLQSAPEWVQKMTGPEALEIARKTMENKIPLLLVTLAGTALCLWGALEMRKLKKQGLLLWTAGEFFPIIASMIILGTGVFSGLAAFVLLFPIIFFIMYFVNRKHLIY